MEPLQQKPPAVQIQACGGLSISAAAMDMRLRQHHIRDTCLQVAFR